MEWTGCGGTHALGMRVQRLASYNVQSFFFLLYLFVMNDREIPRNKFDSTLETSFQLHAVNVLAFDVNVQRYECYT